MSRTLLRRIAGAALAVAVLALAGTAHAGPSSDHAGGPHDRNTIRLTEASEAVQPTFVDTGKPGPSPGDIVVTRDGVLDEAGAPAGDLRQVCTLVDVAGSPFTSTFECTGSLQLESGTITMAGPFVPAAAEQAAAITGGTGELRTARGEVVVRSEADQLVVRLAR